MYTHGQHTTQLTPTACLGMISVETKSQASHYQSQGYRTFRITLSKDIPLLKGEMWCPYPRVQCKDCLLCGSKGRKSIAIPVHGAWAGNFNPEE
jgi:hypothetical protein